MKTNNKQIFISYKRNDNQNGLVNNLVDKLKEYGFSVFFDELDLNTQGSFPEYLKDGVDNSLCFIPILSKNYLDFIDGDKSNSWCLFEAMEAINNNIPIIPILLNDYTNGIYYSDKEITSDVLTKEKVGYILSTSQGVIYNDNYINSLINLISNSFVDSSKCDIFKNYLINNIDTDIIRLYGKEGNTNDDESLYIPLSAKRILTDSEIKNAQNKSFNSKLELKDEVIDPESLMDNILENDIAIITGEAGQGKSTLVKKLHEVLSKKANDTGLNKNEYFPIFLECKKLKDSYDNNKTNLVDQIIEASNMEKFIFDSVFEFSKPLLIINGLDEISENFAREILANLNSFINNPKYKNKPKVIITSRPRGLASNQLIIGDIEVRKYELLPLNDQMFETLINNMFKYISKDNSDISDNAKDDSNRLKFIRIVKEKEEKDLAYASISRNPFFIYPLILYYLSENELPVNRIRLLDFFTTDMLSRETERNDNDLDIDKIKYTLGAIALGAYIKVSENKHAMFGTNEINEAIQIACEDLELPSKQKEILKKYIEHNPYFSKDKGFTHDAYSSYYAAFYWYEYSKGDMDYAKEDIINLEKAGTSCESAVETVLCYMDYKIRRNPKPLLDLISDLQDAIEPPLYDLLTASIAKFVKNKKVCTDLIFNKMMERGIEGIKSFNLDTYKVEKGSNPYNELFYYSVIHNYQEQIINYESENKEKYDLYIINYLLNELHILFDLPLIDFDINEFNNEVFIKASSLERARHNEYTKGHCNVYEVNPNFKSQTYPYFLMDRNNSFDSNNMTSLIIMPSIFDEDSLINCYESTFSNIINLKVHPEHKKYVSINNCICYENKLILGCLNSIIPNEVDTIEDYAFSYCGMKEINIPNNITTIKYKSFTNCRNLEKINIPDSVNTIKEYAFENCESLKKISLPNSIDKISNGLFRGCNNLEFISIPNNIQVIGDSAFLLCVKLKHIILPNNLKVINDHAFAVCRNLEYINLPDSLIRIEDAAFHFCEKLKEINIPANIININNRTFGYCYSLKEINIPNGIEEISEYAFENCENLETVCIPASVKSIANNSFENCDNIKSFIVDENNKYYYVKDNVLFNKDRSLIDSFEVSDIPDNITSIPRRAFENNELMKDIVIPDSVTEIGPMAFLNCFKLKTVKMPKYLNTIEASTFKNCTKLESIIFPQNLEEIDFEAFENCTSLKEVIIPNSVKYLRFNAFTNCQKLEHVKLSDNITELAKETFLYCVNLENIELPKNLKYIASDVFKHCTNLKEIVIPNGVTTIEEDIFKDCVNLEKVTLPNSLEEIGIKKTSMVSNTTFDFLDGDPEADAFDNVYMNNTPSLEFNDVFDSVSFDDLFNDEPEEKHSKYYSIFKGCTNLKDIYFNGTESEWEKLYDTLYNVDHEIIEKATIHFKDK